MKIKKIFSGGARSLTLCMLLFVVFFLTSTINSQDSFCINDVKITKTENNKIFASVALNNKIKITDIVLEKIGSIKVLKLPEYVSRRGKTYPQIKILEKELTNRIIDCIETQKVEENLNNNKIKWEISKFLLYKPKKKSSLKIFAAVKFNNILEIECKIIEGKRNPFVAWPAERSVIIKEEYVPQVLIKKSLKKEIEKELLLRYLTFKEEGGFETFEEE